MYCDGCHASVFSWNSFWHLHNVVRLLQVNKLETKPAMSRFWQVATLKLFRDLPGPLHSICLIHSSFICIQNTARERKQTFICWCHHCHHWWWQWPFLICIKLSSLKKNLSWRFYLIYALNLPATHNSSTVPFQPTLRSQVTATLEEKTWVICHRSQRQSKRWTEIFGACGAPFIGLSKICQRDVQNVTPHFRHQRDAHCFVVVTGHKEWRVGRNDTV